MTYQEQLQQPEWYAKRNEVLVRDKCKCTKCLSTESLHIHHIEYHSGKKAWEYSNDFLITLCKNCHEQVHLTTKIKTISRKTIKIKTVNPLVTNNNLPIVSINGKYNVEAQSKAFICNDSRTGLKKLLFGDESIVSFRGKELLLYILLHLKPDIDYIDLATNILIEQLKWKDREKIILARKELQAIGIIVLKAESVYWINPYYLFCGNRLNYYKINYPQHTNVVSTLRKRLINNIIEE